MDLTRSKARDGEPFDGYGDDDAFLGRFARIDGICRRVCGFKNARTRTNTHAAAIAATHAIWEYAHFFVGCAFSRIKKAITNVCVVHRIG